MYKTKGVEPNPRVERNMESYEENDDTGWDKTSDGHNPQQNLACNLYSVVNSQCEIYNENTLPVNPKHQIIIGVAKRIAMKKE